MLKSQLANSTFICNTYRVCVCEYIFIYNFHVEQTSHFHTTLHRKYISYYVRKIYQQKTFLKTERW